MQRSDFVRGVGAAAPLVLAVSAAANAQPAGHVNRTVTMGVGSVGLSSNAATVNLGSVGGTPATDDIQGVSFATSIDDGVRIDKARPKFTVTIREI